MGAQSESAYATAQTTGFDAISEFAAVVAFAATALTSSTRSRLEATERVVHRWLVTHSMLVLRLTVGAVLLGFGVLKYIPGASPAQDLTVATTRILMFGMVPDPVALVLVASLECAIGLLLLTDVARRLTFVLLAAELIGILSPVVLLPARLFPEGLPTLEAQYVLKDVILVGAAMVLATRVRGARLTTPATAPTTAGVTTRAGSGARQSGHGPTRGNAPGSRRGG